MVKCWKLSEANTTCNACWWYSQIDWVQHWLISRASLHKWFHCWKISIKQPHSNIVSPSIAQFSEIHLLSPKQSLNHWKESIKMSIFELNFLFCTGHLLQQVGLLSTVKTKATKIDRLSITYTLREVAVTKRKNAA